MSMWWWCGVLAGINSVFCLSHTRSAIFRTLAPVSHQKFQVEIFSKICEMCRVGLPLL